jgi:hypothetical protein
LQQRPLDAADVVNAIQQSLGGLERRIQKL